MLGVGRTGRGGAGLRRRLRSARTLVLRTRTTTGRAAAASNLRRRSAAAAVRSAAAAARRWAATSGAGGGMAAAATPASGHRDASVEFSLSNQVSEAEPQGAKAGRNGDNGGGGPTDQRSPTRLDPLGVRLPAQPSERSQPTDRSAVATLCSSTAAGNIGSAMVARAMPSFGASRMLQDASSGSGADESAWTVPDAPETPTEWAEAVGAVVVLLLAVAGLMCAMHATPRLFSGPALGCVHQPALPPGG